MISESQHRNKTNVHIEVYAKAHSHCRNDNLISRVLQYLSSPRFAVLRNGELELDTNTDVANDIEKIVVVDLPENQLVSFWKANIMVHIVRLCDQPPEKDYLDGEENLPAAVQWELPNSSLNGLWDSIIIDPLLKQQLLGYCDTSLLFGEANINPTLITWNRMALLYGPPGTGKTTLCQALAQKLFIRHSHRYSTGLLVEINSHSLFSKWFSESGKLVMKVFDHIQELSEDEQCLVVVLVDEVESIASARQSVNTSQEPGDAIRVVNAVLTSLDSLRRKSNVLVLATSNMIDRIDPAFRDRLDLQIFLGNPNFQARYEILLSCMRELIARNIIWPSVDLENSGFLSCFIDPDISRDDDSLNKESPSPNCRRSPIYLRGFEDFSKQSSSLTFSTTLGLDNNILYEHLHQLLLSDNDENKIQEFSHSHSVGDNSINLVRNPSLLASLRLAELAAMAKGFSGRQLRKLPLQAHALHLNYYPVDFYDYLWALKTALERSHNIFT